MRDELERYGPQVWSSKIGNRPNDADMGVWNTTFYKIAYGLLLVRPPR